MSSSSWVDACMDGFAEVELLGSKTSSLEFADSPSAETPFTNILKSLKIKDKLELKYEFVKLS